MRAIRQALTTAKSTWQRMPFDWFRCISGKVLSKECCTWRDRGSWLHVKPGIVTTMKHYCFQALHMVYWCVSLTAGLILCTWSSSTWFIAIDGCNILMDNFLICSLIINLGYVNVWFDINTHSSCWLYKAVNGMIQVKSKVCAFFLILQCVQTTHHITWRALGWTELV